MSEQDWNKVEVAIIKAVNLSVKETVNGKIDALRKLVEDHNERHEADYKEVRSHIEEVKPIIQAYQGGKVLGNAVKWFSGVAVAIAALWALMSK